MDDMTDEQLEALAFRTILKRDELNGILEAVVQELARRREVASVPSPN